MTTYCKPQAQTPLPSSDVQAQLDLLSRNFALAEKRLTAELQERDEVQSRLEAIVHQQGQTFSEGIGVNRQGLREQERKVDELTLLVAQHDRQIEALMRTLREKAAEIEEIRLNHDFLRQDYDREIPVLRSRVCALEIHCDRLTDTNRRLLALIRQHTEQILNLEQRERERQTQKKKLQHEVTKIKVDLEEWKKIRDWNNLKWYSRLVRHPPICMVEVPPHISATMAASAPVSGGSTSIPWAIYELVSIGSALWNMSEEPFSDREIREGIEKCNCKIRRKNKELQRL